jgi:hypothetical protein
MRGGVERAALVLAVVLGSGCGESRRNSTESHAEGAGGGPCTACNAGGGGASGTTGGGGEAGAVSVAGLPLGASYVLRFKDETSSAAVGKPPSLDNDLVLSLRVDADGALHALLSDPTPLVWEVVPYDLGDRLLLSLSGIVGVSFIDGSVEDRWQQVTLPLTPGGGLDGTFTTHGYRVVGFDTETNMLEGGGVVLPDDIGPVGRPETAPIPPWADMKLTFSEPVNAAELAAATVTLGNDDWPLAELVTSEYKQGGFDAAADVPTILKPGTPWSALLGAHALVDVSGVHDVAGNRAQASSVGFEFASFPLGRTLLPLDDGSEVTLLHGSGVPALGSPEEQRCGGRGCLAVPCNGVVEGVLDATGATKLSVRWRAFGTTSYPPPADLYHQPYVSFTIYREGGVGIVPAALPLLNDPTTQTSLDYDWSTYTISLLDGSANIGFLLTLTTCDSITLLIDSISAVP